MRIITGKARGAKLVTLEGEATRPTAERTKEAIFSVIRFEIAGARVLDLFAGSGQLGLEALSQGAEHAVFCDAAKRAVDVIRSNVEKTRMQDAAEVLCADWQVALKRFAEREQFDLVFLDPPYAMGLLPQVLDALCRGKLLAPGACVVCESAAEADVFGTDAALAQRFEVRRASRYGAAFVSILTPKEEDV
jgi:16S rRNA (guanine(966)-N(2))-methyltransferase RsmD